MPNIFEYKPQLSYILEDINTIDNISDKDIKVEEPYIRNLASIGLEAVDKNISRLNNIISEIDDSLRNYNIRNDSELVDPSLNELVQELNDGDKYLNEGIITYNFYKQSKDIPILSNITNEWERQGSAINGLIEAEVLPFADDVLKDNQLVKKVIIESLVYDKQFTNLKDLKEQEFLELENYIKLKNDLNKLYSQEEYDLESSRSMKKNIDMKNIKLRYTKQTSEIIKDYANESDNMISLMERMVNKTKQNKVETLYREQAEKLNHLVNDRNTAKFLIYQGFKEKYNKFYSMKEELKNSPDRKIKDLSAKSLITNSRLYLDIAMPTVNNIDNSEVGDDMAPAILSLLSGLEDILNKKDLYMLDLKNVLKTTNKKTKDALNLVDEKDKTRRLYKNIK